MIKFLTEAALPVQLNAEFLAELRKSLTLSKQDEEIYQLILTEVKARGEFPFTWTPQETNFLRLHEQKTWLPYIIYRYKFKVYPEKRIVAEYPVYVLFEPTSICNLRCTMCFQIDQSFTQKSFMGMMDFDLYRNMIDQISDGGTQAVTFASRGEPTLHKNLPEMLQYAGGKFFDLKLNTNATKLTEKLAHEILSSDVNELVFSVDAHEKKIYEEIRVRANFDEVLQNIIRFHEIRKKHYPKSALSTRVSGVKFRDDQDEEGFKEFWSNICDQVVYAKVETRWDTYANEKRPDVNEPCNYLWERMYVWYDGIVNPCDADYKSHLAIGNIKESSIGDVWHNPKYTAIRKAHVEGKRNAYMPCDRCGVCF